MKADEVRFALIKIGWPLPTDSAKARHAAIKAFQRGWALGTPLLVDGYAGPKTERALEESMDREGRCALHFRFKEFKSKGDGWIRVSRELVRALEELRKRVGPIGILSAYRDPDYNESVGSMPNSQHVYGNAIDPVRPFDLKDVLAVKRFSGIGFDRSSQKVRHVDVRHVGPNTTGSSIERPARWFY